MSKSQVEHVPKVALITGAARRVGAVIVHFLHQRGMNVIVHYNRSKNEARTLCAELNASRPHSAVALQADLNQTEKLPTLITGAVSEWGFLDVLINNASGFYPTPIGKVSETEWNDLLGSNVKAPFFLSQAAKQKLSERQGCIINIADIHALRPLKEHTVYCVAKAGLVMLTKSLAKELGPAVRVNAIAPGAVMWPEKDNVIDDVVKEKIIASTVLKKTGNPLDIAKATWFFIEAADYVTGQTLCVDGGRSL